MATTSRGGASRSRSTLAKPKPKPSSTRSASARTKSSNNSGSFLSTVRERPFAAAAIAAGAAGASAFLWAKRAQLTEQVSSLSEAIGERFSGSDASKPTAIDSANEFKPQMSSPSSTGKKGRKASATDPMMEEQSAVGAITY